MFTELKRRLRVITKLNQDDLLEEVLENSSLKQDIIDLNRHDQLYEQGIRSDGDSLGEYHPRTMQHKIDTGERYDHVTLKDTGDFYESFDIKNEKGQFRITADTNKEGKDLAFIYGREILGLTRDNIALVRSWIKPIINRLVREKVFR